VRFAERLGFGDVWLTEHYFTGESVYNNSDRVSHPKRSDASEENCGNLSRGAQKIADRGRHREQRDVLTDKTGDLQPQRQPVDREQR